MINSKNVMLVQTCLGQPRPLISGSNTYWSSIYRQPTTASELYLTWTGLAGDQPTDTRSKRSSDGTLGQMHGGNDKAVYAYPIEHYAAWKKELGDTVLGNHSFGENLSIKGLTEDDARIGDRWEWGEAVLEISKVRAPCLTLERYFEGERMIKRMASNGRCGWYLKVLRPGVVPTAGHIHITKASAEAPTVAEQFARKMGG